MTDQMSYLMASLHRKGLQTTLVDDAVTAYESLGSSTRYRLVFIGLDIRPSEAILLIRQVQEMRSRLLVGPLLDLTCADHLKLHCLQSLMNKSETTYDTIDKSKGFKQYPIIE